LTPARTDLCLVAYADRRRNARIRAVYDFLAERLIADAPRFDSRTFP